jgi:hypothetical protein
MLEDGGLREGRSRLNRLARYGAGSTRGTSAQ